VYNPRPLNSSTHYLFVIIDQSIFIYIKQCP